MIVHRQKAVQFLLAILAFVAFGWLMPTPQGLPQASKMALAVGAFALIVWVTSAIESTGFFSVVVLTYCKWIGLL